MEFPDVMIGQADSLDSRALSRVARRFILNMANFELRLREPLTPRNATNERL